MAVKFKDTININGQYTLPLTDGSDGQTLVTDGAGNLTFSSESIAGSADSAESTHLNVKNTSGASIAKGTPVYVTGSVGNTDKLEIAPADASNASHMPAIGLLESTLANNGEGFVVQGGLLKGLVTDTIDGSSSTANDTVYVKAGGGLTLTKPTGSTNFIQNIAKVARVHSSNGSLIVSSILRTNDVPNLSTGKIWVGDSNTIESTVVHIDETNGRVGIGTDSPDTLLDVAKDGTGNDAPIIRITNKKNISDWSAVTDSMGKLEFYSDDSSGNAPYATGFVSIENDFTTGAPTLPSGALVFGTATYNASGGAVERMRIDSSGRVGIGMTPSNHSGYMLQVNGGAQSFMTFGNSTTGTGALNGLVIGNDATGADIYQREAQPIRFHTNNTEAMRIDSSGRVGINETNPSTAKLVIQTDAGSGIDLYRSATNANFEAFRFRDSTNANTEASIGWGGDQLRLNSTNNTVFTTAGTERMRIANNGGIQIPNVNATNEILLTGTEYSNIYSETTSGFDIGTNSSSGASYLRLLTENTERMRIDSSGNFGFNETPENSSGTWRNFQIGGANIASRFSGFNDTMFGTGYIFKTDNSEVYKNTEAVSRVFFNNDSIEFQQAASGTAGTAISWDIPLKIDSSGVTKFMPTKAYGDTSSSVKIFGTFTGTNYSDGSHFNLVFGDDDVTNGYMGSITVEQLNASSSTASEMRFYTNAGGGNGGINPNMVITSSGNVGIGTTSPLEKLHVSTGNDSNSGNIEFLIGGTEGTNARTGRIIKNTSSPYEMTIRSSDFSSGNNLILNDTGGNVGIGTTSPSNDVSGLHIAVNSSTDQLYLERTGGATGRWWLGTANNSLYFQDDVANSTRMIIDSSGIVQVRNQTPTIQLYNTDTAVTLNQTLGDIDWYQSDPSDQGVGTVAKIRAVNIGSIAGYGELAFHTGSATSIDERLRIDYQGNVGIGTTSPNAKLHTVGSGEILRIQDSSATGNPFMSFYQSGTRRGLIQLINGGLLSIVSEYNGIRFMTGTGGTEVERMRIDSSGQVGIGTTSLGAISGTVSTLTLGGTSSTVSGGIAYQVNGTLKAYHYVENNILKHQAQSGIGQSFITNATERMFITSGGSVTAVVDMRAPIFYDTDNTGYYLNPASTSSFNATTTNYVNLAANAAYAVRFWNGAHEYSIRMAQASAATYGGRVAGETTSDYNMYFTMNGGTNRGFVFKGALSTSGAVAGIDASGNGRFIGDVVAYSSSDERLKDNKKNISNALEKVESLNGIEFDWNDKQDTFTGHDIGVIAQEVEKVLPEIVNTRDNGYKAVKYEKLVPLLIEAVKELSEKVKILENK